MHRMTKNTSQVFTNDKTGQKNIKKGVDELTQNHKVDIEWFSGIKPEVQGRGTVSTYFFNYRKGRSYTRLLHQFTAYLNSIRILKL